MKNSKITLSFSKMSDAQLQKQAFAVAAALTNNAHFPEPVPSLADFNNGVKLYVDGLAAAKSKDIVKVAVKNNLRENLVTMLMQLSVYCSYVAKGDRSILASSGFNLNAETSIPKILDAPENFTVQVGDNSGEVYLYVNGLRYAKSYLFLWAPQADSNGSWFHAVSSKSWFIIPGLTPGTTYNFKIGVTGSKDQVVYTKTIAQTVI